MNMFILLWKYDRLLFFPKAWCLLVFSTTATEIPSGTMFETEIDERMKSMSATISNVSSSAISPSSAELADLIEIYGHSEGIPSTQWLTELQLQSPRENLHSLGSRIRVLKRISDILISTVALILLSPVLLLVAIAVKLTSSGPIIFRQTRVGLNLRVNNSDRRQQNTVAIEEQEFEGEDRRTALYDRRGVPTYGRHFTLYKFRTMTTDAEKNGPQFAQQNDNRVTPIGRFLRKTRLDELPQLWNVLKGEMSLVGPRPERPEFIEELSEEIPNYLDRLGLQPGLTGIAQVENGYDNDIEGFKRKVQYDLLYLQNCCLWNDFKIMLRTVRVILTGSGAL